MEIGFHCFCACNALSKCLPSNRTIVVIREIANLNDNALNELLRSLEQMKEGEFIYPIFIETSDFQWAFESPVLSSHGSFIYLRIPEMSYDDAKKDLVDKFKTWNETELFKIYDTLGGHLGSYQHLFVLHKSFKKSLEDSIVELKNRAFAQLREAIEVIENKSCLNEWLIKLKSNNYFMDVKEKPNCIKALFSYNILFLDAKHVYPQKRLMRHAIEGYIDQEEHHKYIDQEEHLKYIDQEHCKVG